VPEVIADIKQFWGNNIPATNYHFFLPSPVTPSDVMAKITALVGAAVSPWPKFNPQMVSLVIKGGKTQVQVKATSQGSLSTSSGGNSSTAGGGTGYSHDQSLVVKSMRISPTIHDALTISGTTGNSDSVSATATAEATGLGPSESTTQSGAVDASVEPTSIPATDGATVWPTAGKYLFRVDAQPYRFGYIQVHAVIVDALDFPTGSGSGGGGGGGPPFVMKANMSVGDAFGTADFLTDLTEAWASFEVRFDAAALAYLATGNVDFVNFQAADTSNRLSMGISDYTANEWFIFREGAGHITSASPAPVADTWVKVDVHFKVSDVSEVYFNDSLFFTTVAGSANPFRKLNFGAFWGTPDPAAVFYLRNFMCGSTRGASDHFFDDLNSGDFSNWDTPPTGNCTVISDPF
jgi:hypothetical protein